MMYRKKLIFNLITAFILFVGLVLGSVPVSAASKMSGLDFSMKKNKSFYINCYTPAGMKSKKVKLKRIKKRKLTASFIMNPFQDSIYYDYFDEDVNDVGDEGYDERHNTLETLEDLLDFYDDYYGTYVIDDFYEEFDQLTEQSEIDEDYDEDEYEDEYKRIINKYYKKVLSKLEVVDVVFKLYQDWWPTMGDVSKCCDTKSFYNETIQLVDYKSGKSLLNLYDDQTSLAKKKGVYVLCADWYYINSTDYYNYYGESIWLVNPTYYQYTIIKPKKYKDICVGVTGDSQLKKSSTDKKFLKGKIDFKKTSWYTKYPNNSKWMRVK